jgi:hypothetical protein
MYIKIYIIIFFIVHSLSGTAQDFNFIEPEFYLCNKIETPLVIDGKMDDPQWQKAKWTDDFVDIEGNKKSKPYLDTKAKMLYDDEFFYFLFKMEEPHIWATLTQRDTVIFYDNDIEIFLDADGDTHNYLEFELNAFNTVWDLFLAKPYREGGPILNSWDFKGLKTAVYIDGTINDASDIDKVWYVEVALPWKSIIETRRSKKIPENGEAMRVNFSRVQWETEVVNNKYQKKKDSETNKNLPENNWVWSPIGAIDMHRPEMWGEVKFVDSSSDKQLYKSDSKSSEELRQFVAYVYNKQRDFKYKNKRLAKNFEELEIDKGLIKKFDLKMRCLSYSFEIEGLDKKSGVIWKSNTEGKLTKN